MPPSQVDNEDMFDFLTVIAHDPKEHERQKRTFELDDF